jgi:hypothetical protein
MSKDDISLKEYFDKRFDDLKDYMELKFANIEKSTLLAQDALDVRLESMNEFRTTMKDEASHFITRSECNISKDKYASEIQRLRETNATTEGKASQKSVNIAYIIAAIGIIISIINGMLYWFSHY